MSEMGAEMKIMVPEEEEAEREERELQVFQIYLVLLQMEKITIVEGPGGLV
jgi:hypothetical protein